MIKTKTTYWYKIKISCVFLNYFLLAYNSSFLFKELTYFTFKPKFKDLFNCLLDFEPKAPLAICLNHLCFSLAQNKCSSNFAPGGKHFLCVLFSFGQLGEKKKKKNCHGEKKRKDKRKDDISLYLQILISPPKRKYKMFLPTIKVLWYGALQRENQYIFLTLLYNLFSYS